MIHHEITLKEYLKTLRCIEKISEYSYSFVYDYCWCCGIVKSNPVEDILEVRPKKRDHNIGRGAGQSVYLKFKKESIVLK